MQLAGPESAIRAALGTHLEDLELLSEDLWQARLGTLNQQEIDKAIDVLRQQSVSIQAITQDSSSLEQAFLQLVQHENRRS